MLGLPAICNLQHCCKRRHLRLQVYLLKKLQITLLRILAVLTVELSESHRCIHGYFWNNTLAICSPCPQGSFGWPPGSSNQHIDTGNHTSLLEEDAIYRSTEGRCRSCPHDTYTRDNATQDVTSCIACPENALSPSPGVPCLCNAGFEAAEVLTTICTACAPGTFKRSRSTSAEPLKACQPCPRNSTSTLYGSQTCYCPANYYGTVTVGHDSSDGSKVNCTRW